MRVETHPGPQHTDQIQALDCPSLLRAGFAYTFIQPDEADKAQDRAFHSTGFELQNLSSPSQLWLWEALSGLESQLSFCECPRGLTLYFGWNQMWYKAIAQFSCQVELQHTATSQRFQIFLLPDRDWNDSIEASRSKNSEHPSYVHVHVRKNHASLAEQTLRIIAVLMW